MAVANNQTQYDDESKSDKIVKEPSPVAPTSERASAVQLTIGPKIPSQENLVSLGHKDDISLPDKPFSTWPLVQLIFATIHLIQTWSPAPARTLFITYGVQCTTNTRLANQNYVPRHSHTITTNIHRGEVASDPHHTMNATPLGWSAHEKCELTLINSNRNQVRKSWHLEREWSTPTPSVSVLLVRRPISPRPSVIKDGSLEGSQHCLPGNRTDGHFGEEEEVSLTRSGEDS